MREIRKLLFFIQQSPYGPYVPPVALVVIVLFISFIVLFPNISRIQTQQAILAERRRVLVELTKKRQVLEAVTEDASLTNLAEAEKALPSEKDPAGIIIAYENLAASTQIISSGIDLTPGLVSTGSATPAPDTAPGQDKHGAKTIAFHVTTAGTYDQQVEFINQLLQVRRLIDITHVNMDFLPDQPDFVNASYELLTYYQPPVAVLGDVGSPLPPISVEETELLSRIAGMPVVSDTLLAIPEGVEGQVGKTNLFTL